MAGRSRRPSRRRKQSATPQRTPAARRQLFASTGGSARSPRSARRGRSSPGPGPAANRRARSLSPVAARDPLRDQWRTGLLRDGVAFCETSGSALDLSPGLYHDESLDLATAARPHTPRRSLAETQALWSQFGRLDRRMRRTRSKSPSRAERAAHERERGQWRHGVVKGGVFVLGEPPSPDGGPGEYSLEARSDFSPPPSPRMPWGERASLNRSFGGGPSSPSSSPRRSRPRPRGRARERRGRKLTDEQCIRLLRPDPESPVAARAGAYSATTYAELGRRRGAPEEAPRVPEVGGGPRLADEAGHEWR